MLLLFDDNTPIRETAPQVQPTKSGVEADVEHSFVSENSVQNSILKILVCEYLLI